MVKSPEKKIKNVNNRELINTENSEKNKQN